MMKPSKQRKHWSFVRTKADVLRERRMQVERLEKRCALSATPLAPADVPPMDLPTPEVDLFQAVVRVESGEAGSGGLLAVEFSANAGPTLDFEAALPGPSPSDRGNLPTLMDATRAIDLELATFDRQLTPPTDGRLPEWGDAMLPTPDVSSRGPLDAAHGGSSSRIYDLYGERSPGTMPVLDGQMGGMGQFGGDLLSRGPEIGGSSEAYVTQFVIADSFRGIQPGPERGMPGQPPFGSHFEAFDSRAALFREALDAAIITTGMRSILAGSLSTVSTPQNSTQWTEHETTSTSITSWSGSPLMSVGRETSSDSAIASESTASTSSSLRFGTMSDGLAGLAWMSDGEGSSLTPLHLDGIAAKGATSYRTRTVVLADHGSSENLGRELTVSSDMGQLDRVFYPVTVAASTPNAVALLDIGTPEAALQDSSELGGVDVRAVVSRQEIALDAVMAQAYAFSLDSVEDGQSASEGEAVAARVEAAVPQPSSSSEESTTTDERSAMQDAKPASGIDAASLLLAAAPLAKRRWERKGPRSTRES